MIADEEGGEDADEKNVNADGHKRHHDTAFFYYVNSLERQGKTMNGTESNTHRTVNRGRANVPRRIAHIEIIDTVQTRMV